MKAAVLRSFGDPLVIEDVEIDSPAPFEVLVETKACGVCHSDLSCAEGKLQLRIPTILGHEPAGIVREVGANVTHVQPGDHVIGCLSAYCGECDFCLRGEPSLCGGHGTLRPRDAAPRLRSGDESIRQFQHLSAFAERMLVHENAVVRIRDDMPLDRASLVGCGVTTGLGAALNTAQVRPGDTCVVIACGGVGLAAIQGCRIAGASTIIAVDTNASKLELARTLGATHGIDARADDLLEQVIEITKGGADHAFECIGTVATCDLAYGSLRKGGNCVIVGILPTGATWPVLASDLPFSGKRILGAVMGHNRFRIDIPRYVDFYMDGRLLLDEMISARISLDAVNEALGDLQRGEGSRQIIVFD
jgi:S-(hydroxymethyl)glutathione dehydrogenase / alcohol dehydrogenase